MFKRVANLLAKKKQQVGIEEVFKEFIKVIKETNLKDTCPSEVQLFENLVAVHGKDIESLIVPRSDLVAVEAKTEINKIVNLVVKTGFSRIPVYENNLDNILGFIHAKDILYYSRHKEDFEIEKITRDIIFINPYMKILRAIAYLRQNKAHIAIVLDEFGSVSGLVTLEEMIEEIIGDIQDEHDRGLETLITKISDGIATVVGKTPLDELEKAINYVFAETEKEEVNTVSGLVLSMVGGTIPEKNQVIKHQSGIEFTIIARDRNKINSIKVDFRNLNKEQ